MTEYIERRKVLAGISRLLHYADNNSLTDYGDGLFEATSKAMDIVETAPAADVRLERRGEWVHLGGDEWGCSQCGYIINTDSSQEHPLSETRCNNYCRKCGALMDRKGGENNE